MTVAKEEQQELQRQDGNNGNNNNKNRSGLDLLISMVKEKGFEIEQQKKDYGAGPIDLIVNIGIHPALPKIKCGFIVLKSEEGGAKDWQDNQYSLRKIEEAILRGIRSRMDKTYLVADNEEIAKSVSGKIEWLASFAFHLDYILNIRDQL